MTVTYRLNARRAMIASFVVLSSAAATVALSWSMALAQPDSDPPIAAKLYAPGDPLPRVQCTQGYTASIYAEGLSSPDSLTFDAGELYVAEEKAGRVSRIDANGNATPIVSGLNSPEGIAFDDAGNLYVVEDVEAGRLIKRTPAGVTSTLASDLDAPEGVVWTPGGTLYVTESNIQFESNPLNLHARVTAVSPSGVVTRVITDTPIINGVNVSFWSYAEIARGANGQLYVTNELSGKPITLSFFTLYTIDSVFIVTPTTGSRVLFASGMFAPEGLGMPTGSDFPMYVAEENVSGDEGELSRVETNGSHTPVCTGLLKIEDVAVGPNGWLYVSEDASGLIILIKPAHPVFLPLLLRAN